MALLLVQAPARAGRPVVVVAKGGTTAEVGVCTTYSAGTGSASEAERVAAVLAFDALSQLTASERKLSPRSLAQRGGREVSKLGTDFAQFCTVVPKAELSFAIWLEANRLAGATLDKETMQACRVRRLQEAQEALADPKQVAEMRLAQIVFAGHPVYENASGVSREALLKAQFSDVQAFFARRYLGARAALAVVGDVSEEHVRSLVARQFPAGSKVSPWAVPELERFVQTSERYSTLIDQNAKAPIFFHAWAIPGADREQQRARLAIELVARLVENFGGSASQTRWGVQGWRVHLTDQRDVAALRLSVEGTPLLKPDLLNSDLDRYLAQLASAGSTEGELAQAKSALLTSLDAELSNTMAHASWLSERTLSQRFREATQVSKLVNEISVAELRDVVVRYLQPTHRTRIEVYPAKWYEPGPPIPRYHLVKAGETLGAIARAERVTLEALRKANSLAVGKPIAVGQKLLLPKSTLPPARRHRVRKGDTLSGLAKRYDVSVAALSQVNGIAVKKPLQVGQELLLP